MGQHSKEVERIQAVTSTQRQSFSSGLCLYSPKWKMIGPSIQSTYNSRRNLKRQFFTFGIGKIIFLFEMFSLFKNELTFVVCLIISKQFSYLLSCGGVDFCGRALQKRNKVVRHAGPCQYKRKSTHVYAYMVHTYVVYCIDLWSCRPSFVSRNNERVKS